jgi:hypothetical protein
MPSSLTQQPPSMSSPTTPTSKKHKLVYHVGPMELKHVVKTFKVSPLVRRNLLDSFEKAALQ